jgi:hypothetical protein
MTYRRIDKQTPKMTRYNAANSSELVTSGAKTGGISRHSFRCNYYLALFKNVSHFVSLYTMKLCLRHADNE